jgi:hypothetical protein
MPNACDAISGDIFIGERCGRWQRPAPPPPRSLQPPGSSFLSSSLFVATTRGAWRCCVLGDIAPADRYVLTERDRAPRACPTRRVVAADAGLNPDRAPATLDRSPPGTLGAERGSASDPAREPDELGPDASFAGPPGARRPGPGRPGRARSRLRPSPAAAGTLRQSPTRAGGVAGIGAGTSAGLHDSTRQSQWSVPFRVSVWSDH